MKKFLKVFFINLMIFALCIEFFSFILVKMSILPNGLPPNLILTAHEKFSYWHPINSKLKIATKCWSSEVEFNNIGIKSDKDIITKKFKKRIAIMGDSMTENGQLSNNNDFTKYLQNLFPKYEVINFSVSSVGLADQIKIYKNLVNQYNVDYVFLYLSHNDFSDNHISEFRGNREAYDIINGKVVNVNADKTEFFKYYNSNWNKFKREKLIYIKKNLHTFKLYYHLKWYLISLKYKDSKDKDLKLKKSKNKNNYFDQKEKIFSYLVEKANLEIFSKVPTLIFMNSHNFDFTNKNVVIEEMKKNLVNYNVFDPQQEFIKYLTANNQLKKPYLGYSCDAHYSELGIKLLSKYTLEKFLELKKNNVIE